MKTLVIIAHPDIENSVVNQRWLAELRKYPERYTVHELYRAYPDWKIDVEKEQQLLEAHENIVLQFPVYWFSSPPLLKKWQDDVLTYGWAYGSESGYKMQGRNVALAVTAGILAEDYAPDGRYLYPLEDVLRPFEITVNYIRAKYKPCFAFYGTEYIAESATAKADIERSAWEYHEFLSSLN